MILVANFYNSLQSSQQISPVLKEVLKDLYRLFGLYTIDNESREFFKAGAVSDKQLDGLSQKILELMGRIRPHTVPLVDAWVLPDYLLNRYVLNPVISLHARTDQCLVLLDVTMEGFTRISLTGHIGLTL